MARIQIGYLQFMLTEIQSFKPKPASADDINTCVEKYVAKRKHLDETHFIADIASKLKELKADLILLAPLTEIREKNETVRVTGLAISTCSYLVPPARLSGILRLFQTACEETKDTKEAYIDVQYCKSMTCDILNELHMTNAKEGFFRGVSCVFVSIEANLKKEHLVEYNRVNRNGQHCLKDVMVNMQTEPSTEIDLIKNRLRNFTLLRCIAPYTSINFELITVVNWFITEVFKNRTDAHLWDAIYSALLVEFVVKCKDVSPQTFDAQAKYSLEVLAMLNNDVPVMDVSMGLTTTAERLLPGYRGRRIAKKARHVLVLTDGLLVEISRSEQKAEIDRVSAMYMALLAMHFIVPVRDEIRSMYRVVSMFRWSLFYVFTARELEAELEFAYKTATEVYDGTVDFTQFIDEHSHFRFLGAQPEIPVLTVTARLSWDQEMFPFYVNKQARKRKYNFDME
jgi:hypothetical protein